MNIESTSSPGTLIIVNDFLSKQYSGILSTADSAANPHGAVIYYTYNDDYTLSFVTKTETQKYKNIEENKKVAMTIYNEQQQASAQIMGRVEVINDEDESAAVMNKTFKYSAELSGRELPPLEKLFAGEYVALRIIPQVIKMAVFARPETGQDELFETILFSEKSDQ